MRFSRSFSACLGLGVVAAYTTGRSEGEGLALHRRTPVSNGSRVLHEDVSELQKRDGTKYVFMHHIVGNTYVSNVLAREDPLSTFAATTTRWTPGRTTSSKSLPRASPSDAIALNIGGDDWQMTQVGNAYAAAQALGVSTKLFFSFDFTTNLGCSLPDIVARTRQFSSHPWQFKVGAKPMVSSYSGDCLGNAGWQSLKDQTGAYVMPFIWGLEGNFGSYPSLDSWYCWGCAWPQGDYDKNTDDDNYYISQLGLKYATTVSMWFFTHLSDKNRILRSDDWLINSRWEQLVAMRNQLTFVEMVTWNDFGESDYRPTSRQVHSDIYLIAGYLYSEPGTTWADGYPHTAWFDMSAYYIQAFKTGMYPPITQDVIYYWARPHPHDAIISGDGAQPDNWSWTQDYLWVAAFCSSTCTVKLTCGASSGTFADLPAGVNKLKISLAPGQIGVVMTKGGQTVISKTDPDYRYVTNPTLYNFNAFVGAATASGTTTPATTTLTPTTTPAPTTTTMPTTTPTSTATTAASASSTSVAGVSWNYLGCYPDPNSPRTLNNGIHTSTQTNSVATCLATCRNAGYVYAGVEYGVECWCASTMTSGVSIAAAGDCSMTCSSGTGTCGGGNRINVYFAASGFPATTTVTTTTTPTTTTTTSTSTSTPSWAYVGCYVDNANPRTLNNGLHYTSQTGQSVSSCLAACAGSGYLYGGTEYGVECWCASALSAGATTAASGDCNMKCSGGAGDVCGAGNRISVYKASSVAAAPTLSWSSLGCYQDYSPRTLNNGINFSSASLTIQTCQAACGAAGYHYAGVEYSQECWCSSAITSGVSTAASGDCNMPCTGASGTTCGGGNRIWIYVASTTSAKRRRLHPAQIANQR
ncbi:glycosyl hydrolase family 71-domain-containing protein [Mycena epipterygia]|nr:glycosyl hydrolase family 71-domain-containing protein [Mycena epipterygia]